MFDTFLLGHPVYGAPSNASLWQMGFNLAFKGIYMYILKKL